MKRIVLLISILMCTILMSAQTKNGVSFKTSKITHFFVDTDESVTSKMNSEIRIGEGIIAFKNSIHNRAFIVTDYEEDPNNPIWLFYVNDQEDKNAIIVVDLIEKFIKIYYKDIEITLFPITEYAEFKY